MIKHPVLLLLVLVVIACGAPTNVFCQTGTKATQQAAWALGDTLSLAAVGHGEGIAPTTVNNLFLEAKANGKKLNLTVPDLPAKTADKIENKATVLQYMLNVAGKPIGQSLTGQYGQDHAVLFELALKSNILLMMYGPGEGTTKSIANVIRTRSERLGLPPAMTANLLSLIDAGADYAKVKTAIFQMHKDVANYLRAK